VATPEEARIAERLDDDPVLQCHTRSDHCDLLVGAGVGTCVVGTFVGDGLRLGVAGGLTVAVGGLLGLGLAVAVGPWLGAVVAVTVAVGV
jgi:hypothetical protein